MLEIFKHARVRSLLTLIFLFVAFGTLLFMYLEQWPFDEAFYYSIATVTTVGHPDLIPDHPLSRVIAGIYMAFVIPLILITLGVVADTMHDLRVKEEKEEARRARMASKTKNVTSK